MFLNNEYCGNLAFSAPICFSSVGFRFFCKAFYGRLLWILCAFVFWANSNDTGLTHRRQAAKTTVRLVALCVILLLGSSFVVGSTRRETNRFEAKLRFIVKVTTLRCGYRSMRVNLPRCFCRNGTIRKSTSFFRRQATLFGKSILFSQKKTKTIRSGGANAWRLQRRRKLLTTSNCLGKKLSNNFGNVLQ